MPITEASSELPVWPSGVAEFADGILEVTTGEGIGGAAADIVQIGVEPPRAGRRSLALVDRAWLDRVDTSFGVEPGQQAALRLLANAVMDTKRDA
jgi:hypothetical protein